tara:strand:+ start:180 stop:530 length:351 start_codon:yes stop_codon:yes gene_type:complete
MKKKIILVFTILSLITCSKENSEETNDCYQIIDGVFADEKYCDGEPGFILIEVSGEDFIGQTPLSFFYDGLVIKEGNIIALDINQFSVLIDSPIENGTLEVSSGDGCIDSYDILCQ